MAKTTASIVIDRSGRKAVRVVTAAGHVDWPVFYSFNGRVGYDRPEAVPAYIRPKVERLLRQLHAARRE